MNPPKKILIGLDLLPTDNNLITQGCTFAKAFGANLWLLHVTTNSGDDLKKQTSPKPVSQLDKEHITSAQKTIVEHCKAIKDMGIACDGQVITGSTTEIILSEIDQINAELLIIGEKKHGTVYKALMGGSTSSKILKQIGIPVLLVPIAGKD